MSLDLAWNEGLGFVEFIADSVPAGYTIFRVDQYNNLTPIANYTTDWWLSGGAGFGEDYRAPLGVTATYCLAPIGTKVYDDSYTTSTVDTPGDEAWLRDVTKPAWSTRVIVVSTGDEAENVIQRVYNVTGRRLPLVVHDLRQGRSGQVTLFVGELFDQSTGALVRDGRTQRNRVEQLLSTGNPLFLHMCYPLGWAQCMMAVGNATFTRVGSNANWTLTLDYTEVDDPVNYSVAPIPRESYQDIANGLPSAPGDPTTATYQWVKDSFLRYIDIATANRTDQ